MIEWITDRLPTADDCNKSANVVWVSGSHIAYIDHWSHVKEGEPWMPITTPELYVKPKRHFVVWSELFNCWSLRELSTGGAILLADHVLNVGLTKKNEQHREAAERIAEIYNEVMP